MAEARGLKNQHVGTTHLLLGLLGQRGPTAEALRRAGLTGPEVRDGLVAIDGFGAGSPPGTIPPTKNLLHVFDAAVDVARRDGDEEVGTDHLLKALLASDRGLARQVLRKLRISAASVFEALRESTAMGGEPMERVPTHPDRPAVIDQLNRRRLAEVIAERIRRARNEDTERQVHTLGERREKLRRDREAALETGGFLVHVHAPWGAGKSSLLNFLAADLRNRKRDGRGPARPELSQWVVVEFSAWEHQRLVTPWWWLLTAVRRSCARELWSINRGRWLWFWVRDIGWRLWNARAAALVLFLLAATLLAAWRLDWFGLGDERLTTVQAVILTSVPAVALLTTFVGFLQGTSRWLAVGSAEGAERFLRRAHDPLAVYRKRFENLVQASGRPIAIFIDDLDRCNAEYVVELLEGIQTLFIKQPVAFVVAADRSWLCQSFACAYDDFSPSVGEIGRPLGYLFLEKTFQVSLQIPPMSDEVRGEYWKALMHPSRDRNGAKKVDAEELTGAFAEARTQSQVEAEVEELLAADLDDEEVLAAAVRRLNAPALEEQTEAQLSRFSGLVENNPRSMKRMMNAYGIERDRLFRDGYMLTPLQRQQLALRTIVQLRWPELADHLQRHPEDAVFGLEEAEPVPKENPFAKLFVDTELRKVFDGDGVEASLDAEVFRHFPSRSGASSDQVNASPQAR
ncbi:MAG TPA: P-loop NTPase fold protein [Solirubrobacterales bacterium]|nr:P-loop NTPase fold protein [Solirubrobacterales bacterium]